MAQSLISIPARMIPIDSLVEPVEVIKAPQVRTERDSEVPATSQDYPGRRGYELRVEYTRGMRTKTMPDGSEITFPEVEEVKVTVWSETPVDAKVGDYIRFQGLAIGAFSSQSGGTNFYYQAQGIVPASNKHNEKA